jgi:transposase
MSPPQPGEPQPSSANVTDGWVKQRGKKRALVAVGHSILTTIWHLLSDPDAHYHDLGPDFYDTDKARHRHQQVLIHRLEHLTGSKVILQPTT